ncbi:FRG1-like family protein [Purpureocillium lavendulum]|uniref:FRG1-like family protein n=1 Tax=Purpureocillium lavendulum TaxID=1247861 RepID=A0AB34FU90_9HYPO|nr:FRG1-like family protein [Purpureocillium lavendulum]
MSHLRDRVLGHNAPRKLAKREMLLNVHFLAEVGLREDGQRVPGHAPVADARPHAPDKVRHGLEAAGRDALQGLARLEGDAVAGDLDLHRLAGARLDVQAGLGVGRGGELRERRQRGARAGGGVGGDGGADLLLVDEHGRREAGQAAVVEVGGAPVVLGGAVVVLQALGEVVQQAGLCGVGRADDVLEVAARVALDLALGEAVAGAGDEHGHVDDEAAQGRDGGLEARQDPLVGPQVGRQVLGERLRRELGRGLGALERRVHVEGAVGVDEYDNAMWRSWGKSWGTSLTTRMPSESGPKAACRVSNETVPTPNDAPQSTTALERRHRESRRNPPSMVKPLTFKGDKKPKKRKRDKPAPGLDGDGDDDEGAGPATKQLQRARDTGGGDDDDAGAGDDTWVSAEAVADVVGPVMIVLPTDKPSALACDPSGKVFAMPVENMVDDNPATAEPHDVRQVWVANKIAGTENFRFKGHHGRRCSYYSFLACDKIGLLSATSEAVSPLECFSLIATADTPGTFQVQTLRDTFLSVKPSTSAKPGAPPAEVRGDADAIAFDTTLRVRMQARFKPKLRASKEERALAKISRRELEEAAGRKLSEDEIRMLKRARREGDYHEKLLDIKVKGKHDKFA